MVILFWAIKKTGDGNKMRLENNIYIYIYIKLFSTKILCEKQCFSKQINKIKIKVQKVCEQMQSFLEECSFAMQKF